MAVPLVQTVTATLVVKVTVIISGHEVEDVQVGFSVSKLSQLSTKLEAARRARLYCENHLRKGRQLTLKLKIWKCNDS